MSQLVRLEGKHTTQNAHCALDKYNIMYVYEVTFIQTFVYLFAPLAHNIRESDFEQNMRLQVTNNDPHRHHMIQKPSLHCIDDVEFFRMGKRSGKRCGSFGIQTWTASQHKYFHFSTSATRKT